MANIQVKSEITGIVSKILVQVGDEVDVDTPLIYVESMKMDIPLVAPKKLTVIHIHINEGDNISEDDLCITLG